MRTSIGFPGWAVLVGLTGTAWAADIGTAFTYQGYLEKPAGTPVTDTCDFRFSLWRDAASVLSADQVGTLQSALGVAVADGAFSTTIDFGAGAIDGTARWLAIEVMCPGDVGFVLLTPRVELTPVPHALALRNLRAEPAGPDALNYYAPNVIGGYYGNSVEPGVVGATVFGGGGKDDPFAFAPNTAEGSFATTGGGLDNAAREYASTVGGGEGNSAHGLVSTVSGGSFNDAIGDYSTAGGGKINTPSGDYSTVSGGFANDSGHYSAVGGGRNNQAFGSWSAVGGGAFNNPLGNYSTVPGGTRNDADGDFSFAAGRRAKVRRASAIGENPFTCGDTNICGDEGAFVWADSTNADFTSTGVNQFLIRATGGMRLATGDGATPQFQAVLPSVDGSPHVAEDLALQPLGGKVGIGTTTPSNELDVRSSSPSAGGQVVAANSNADTWVMLWSGYNNGSNDPAILWSDNLAGDGLRFLTTDIDGNNGTEWMRINGSNGFVGIGDSSPDAALDVVGDIHHTGTITQVSDRRLKENITPLGNALHRIEKLEGVFFNRKETPDRRDVGLIAQDVQAVLPEAIRIVDPDTGHLGVSYPSLIPLLVEAIKEMETTRNRADGVALAAIQGLYAIVQEKDCEIEELKGKAAAVETLEARVMALEALVTKLAGQQNGGSR